MNLPCFHPFASCSVRFYQKFVSSVRFNYRLFVFNALCCSMQLPFSRVHVEFALQVLHNLICCADKTDNKLTTTTCSFRSCFFGRCVA